MLDSSLPKMTCFVSHDMFKFWKTPNNISETVQDRDTVETEDSNNSNTNGLEGHSS